MRFKLVLQSDSCNIVSMEFSHTERGCGDFSFQFAQYVGITKADIVKVYLFNNDNSFYCGVVRSVPIPGSTAKGFTYSGLGFNDYLGRVSAENLAYASKTLAYIVGDVIDKIVVLKTNILKLAGNLVLPAITVTFLTINYASVTAVLDALLNIANSSGQLYVYGVDQDGYFFFRPRSSTVVATLTVGKTGDYGIPSYEPSDEQEQTTTLFVLRDDGTYLDLVHSALNNDIFEQTVKAPVLSDIDIMVWARGKLFAAEQGTRSATVEWKVKTDLPTLLVADGVLRIVSDIPPSTLVTVIQAAWGDGNWGDNLWGGNQNLGVTLCDVLDVKEVTYRISTSGVARSISLGAVPLRVEDMVARIDGRLTSLEVAVGV